MGQRQDEDEIIYGNDCLLGWEEGKTPKYVYARFSQIVKCPDGDYTPPNDRVFKLTQDPEAPCWWAYRRDKWTIYFVIHGPPVYSWIELRQFEPAIIYFTDYVWGPPEEGRVFYNDNPACVANIGGASGMGVITWRLETLKIMKALNIEPAYNLFSEMRPLPDGNKVYKFCKLQYGMNIAIEYESD